MKEIKTTSFDLSRVIRRLEDAIKNGWNVKIDNQKYKLKVDIGKGYGPLSEISDGVFQRTRHQNGDNDSIILHLLSKREELSSNNLILSPFILTKLYFCRKVQLENDEYLIDRETLVLFPNSTVRKRLYSHEYSLTSIGKSPEAPEVRNVHVCADDFAPESSVINSHCGSISYGVSRLLHYLNIFIVIKLSARRF